MMRRDDPDFKKMVDEIRETEKALGSVNYDLTDKIKKSRTFARSLFVVRDIKSGEIFSEINIRSIRPSNGISPKYLKDVIGKKSVRDIEKGTPLSWDLIER